MFVCRLFSIFFLFNFYEVFEIIKIYFVVGFLLQGFVFVMQCFFCVLYYIISDVVLVGGGFYLSLGEISFVYNGVLFLDEFLEFKWIVLEVMC